MKTIGYTHPGMVRLESTTDLRKILRDRATSTEKEKDNDHR